jgi:hypothetical protein
MILRISKGKDLQVKVGFMIGCMMKKLISIDTYGKKDSGVLQA